MRRGSEDFIAGRGGRKGTINFPEVSKYTIRGTLCTHA